MKENLLSYFAIFILFCAINGFGEEVVIEIKLLIRRLGINRRAIRVALRGIRGSLWAIAVTLTASANVAGAHGKCRFHFSQIRPGEIRSGAATSAAKDKREEILRSQLSRVEPHEFAKAFYGESSGEILVKLEGLGSNFKELVVDPGLIQHLDEFVEFTRVQAGREPWEMRRQFRQKIGTTTVYRLMGFNDEAKEAVMRTGIHSPWKDKYNLEAIKKLTFKDWVWGHMSSGQRSFLVSVTNHPELWYLNTRFYINIYGVGLEDRSVYLFAVNVNKADVIGPREGVKWIYPEGTPMERDAKITHEDGRVEIIKGIGNKESFVLFGIQPEEIISVTKYEYKGSVE